MSNIECGIDRRARRFSAKLFLFVNLFICAVCAENSFANDVNVSCNPPDIIFHQNVQYLLRNEVVDSVKKIFDKIQGHKETTRVEVSSFYTEKFTSNVINKITDIPSWRISINYISGQSQGCIIEKHYKSPGEISWSRLQVEWNLRTLERNLVGECLKEALDCK